VTTPGNIALSWLPPLEDCSSQIHGYLISYEAESLWQENTTSEGIHEEIASSNSWQFEPLSGAEYVFVIITVYGNSLNSSEAFLEVTSSDESKTVLLVIFTYFHREKFCI